MYADHLKTRLDLVSLALIHAAGDCEETETRPRVDVPNNIAIAACGAVVAWTRDHDAAQVARLESELASMTERTFADVLDTLNGEHDDGKEGEADVIAMLTIMYPATTSWIAAAGQYALLVLDAIARAFKVAEGMEGDDVVVLLTIEGDLTDAPSVARN